MQMYTAAFPDVCVEGGSLVNVKCKDASGALLDHIVFIKDGTATALMGECLVMYTDLRATQMIEYCFDDGEWFLTKVIAPAFALAY